MYRIQAVQEVGAELFGSNPIEQPVAGSRNDARATGPVGSKILLEKEQQLGLLLPAQTGDFFDQQRAAFDSLFPGRVARRGAYDPAWMRHARVERPKELVEGVMLDDEERPSAAFAASVNLMCQRFSTDRIASANQHVQI